MVEGLAYDAMKVLADCTGLSGAAYPIEAVLAKARRQWTRPSRGYELVAITQQQEGPVSEAQDDRALVAAQNHEKNVVTYTGIPIAAILLELASPQPGEQVVDVACGTGVVARQTAPREGAAGAVVGVDINPALAETVGLGITLVCG